MFAWCLWAYRQRWNGGIRLWWTPLAWQQYALCLLFFGYSSALTLLIFVWKLQWDGSSWCRLTHFAISMSEFSVACTSSTESANERYSSNDCVPNSILSTRNTTLSASPDWAINWADLKLVMVFPLPVVCQTYPPFCSVLFQSHLQLLSLFCLLHNTDSFANFQHSICLVGNSIEADKHMCHWYGKKSRGYLSPIVYGVVKGVCPMKQKALLNLPSIPGLAKYIVSSGFIATNSWTKEKMLSVNTPSGIYFPLSGWLRAWQASCCFSTLHVWQAYRLSTTLNPLCA